MSAQNRFLFIRAAMGFECPQSGEKKLETVKNPLGFAWPPPSTVVVPRVCPWRWRYADPVHNKIPLWLYTYITYVYNNVYINNIIYADGAVFFLQGHIVITTHARDLHPFVLLLLLLLCARVPVDFVVVWHNTISGGLCAVVGNENFL